MSQRHVRTLHRALHLGMSVARVVLSKVAWSRSAKSLLWPARQVICEVSAYTSAARLLRSGGKSRSCSSPTRPCKPTFSDVRICRSGATHIYHQRMRCVEPPRSHSLEHHVYPHL